LFTIVGRVKGILNKACVASRASCDATSTLFDLLTGKSYYHLPEICALFRQKYNMALDEEIQRSNISTVSKKVLVHLTRTAVGLAYRDAKLLQDALEMFGASGDIGEALLAIRVRRMSWYEDHFKRVREQFCEITGVEFNKRIKSMKGPLGEIIRQVCT
jgi:hypothetical protein